MFVLEGISGLPLFKKRNWGDISPFGGLLIPLYGLFITSALGFKARFDPYLCLYVIDSRFLRFIFGVTPVVLFAASIVLN